MAPTRSRWIGTPVMRSIQPHLAEEFAPRCPPQAERLNEIFPICPQPNLDDPCCELLAVTRQFQREIGQSLDPFGSHQIVFF